MVFKTRSQKTAYGYKKMYKRMSNSIQIKPNFVDKTSIDNYLSKWKQLDRRVSPQSFILYCNNNGEIDTNYVPDFLFDHLIGRTLNNARYEVYYSDKNLDDIKLSEKKHYTPKTVLRKIWNVYYDDQYNSISDLSSFLQHIECTRIIAKPSIDDAGGRGIDIFYKEKEYGNYINNDGCEISEWMKDKSDLIIQEVAGQNDFYKGLNPSSINTVRVVTYRSVKDEVTRVMQSLLRVGNIDSFVDNWHSGGHIVNINKDGVFGEYGYNMNFDKIRFSKAGVEAPHILGMHQIAIELSRKYLFHRVLSFDFFVDSFDNIMLVEINTGAAPWLQFIAGPLFGEYADEVIEYCNENKGFRVITVSSH